MTVVKNVCAEMGHHYFRTDQIYARDENGAAFRGGANWHTAEKFCTYVCSRCLDSKEVRVSPRLVVKTSEPNKSKPASAGAAPAGKPLYSPPGQKR